MDIQQLESLVGENLSMRRIAKKLNCSPTNVKHWINKLELKFPELCSKGQRYCKCCKNCKPEEEFYQKKLGGFYPYCKICTSRKAVEKQQDIKKKCIEYKGGKCENCGYNKSQAALHFHHINPLEKEFTIASKAQISFERMIPELNKCVLLCANCHAEKHEEIDSSTHL